MEKAFQLATGSQTYRLPSRYTITSQLNQLYASKQQEILDKLKRQPAASLALTLDYWTSLSNESYLGVTCHFIDEDWKMNVCTLAVDHAEQRHTSDNVRDQILKIIKHWEIEDKVMVIITDNANNMVKAARELPFSSFTCSAHSLQLSLNKALKECNAEEALAKLRRIVGHYKRSPASFTELKQTMAEKGEKPESLVSIKYCNGV